MRDRLESLETVLTLDLTAHLLGVSRETLLSCDEDTYHMPETVRERLILVEKIVDTLRGAYNDTGIRMWFFRKRIQLSGKSPAKILRGEWNPNEQGPMTILELAKSINI